MPAARSTVFTIPASVPFLPALIGALRGGTLLPGFPDGGGPLELARATIYLPTRRACRLAREVFLDTLDGDAAILPRIVALGDVDEDEIAFADAAAAELAEEALRLPPAITPLERRLLLAELILKWANSPEMRGTEGSPLIANTPSAALGLADDLARLMDDMTTRQVSWGRLDGLVPEDLDSYWQLSLRFLKIAREAWPALRAEQGAIEAAERRDKLIEAEAKRLAQSDAPVIAAGSTGSMPATAQLLATIAGLPHGAVVLPGLDTRLDDASWTLIAGNKDDKTHDGLPAAGHPQFAMQALLDRIGITRADVIELTPPAPHGREALVSEVLRPASTTERWQRQREQPSFADATDRALGTVSMIEAANAEEEALAIAIALREAIETPHKTAALVTPDRALARRVVAALERWRVPVDDSAGVSLADASAGVFARLAAEAALGGLAPATLLALLKHPLFRLTAGKRGNARPIATIEHALLRGPRPRAGSDGLDRAFAAFRLNRAKLHLNDTRWLIADDRFDIAAEFITRLGAALAPLESVKKAHSFADFARRHSEVIVSLGQDAHGAVAAFAERDGVALEDTVWEIIDSPSAASLKVEKRDYVELFHAAIAGRVVRRPELRDVRVHIYGPLEARLQTVDCMVLGGLNEGTWPPETRSDPWLSRPMRAELGLDAPERRTGLAAHDFAQALGAPEVILSRAAKVAGAPTIRSRFVQRIIALAGERWTAVVARGDDYLAWARALDAPASVTPAARPAPTPPPQARPDQLSVTDIENWLRDPYTIYAKRVLKLFPLEPVDAEPGAADRGSVIHEAIGKFTQKYSGAELPADPERELVAFGEQSFAPWQDFPEARGFWWPRFKRIAHWLAGWERERRGGLAMVYGEIKGRLDIPLQARTFTLSARADRIERRRDGAYAILDYKTGQPPTAPQVQSGLAPQLTLEAAILKRGGFENVAAGPVVEISYVRLKGGEPPVEPKEIKFSKGSTPDSCADDALAKLTGLATRFIVDGEPYRSLVHPMWTRHYGEYDHLARVKEWAASGGESEYEGPPT
jgi:ATP-dependent helicase/nuclease subunit B